MLCQFERLIYPPNPAQLLPSSYIVAVYKPCENVRDGGGNIVSQVKAVGYCLPISAKLRYDIKGHWSKSSKHGVQFEVETYDEVVVPSKDGIIAYLCSGQIKGIGPKIAERIYAAFGDTTLDVLDNDPEKLLSVSGISQNKLKKICESYIANRGARDVVAFLVPYGITANRAVQFYKKYQNKTMEIVKEHPYRLCEIPGIGFLTADKIALSMGFDRLSTDRVDEGMLYTLSEAEGKGHLCMEKHAFVRACLKLLDTEDLTEEMVGNRAMRLINDGKLMTFQGNVYRATTAAAEAYLAYLVARRVNSKPKQVIPNLDMILDREETKLNISMAEEQRLAVKTALTQRLSVITGGPGTGKTLIQHALLDIYIQHNPDKKVCCCAPTGRAARRMEQSTGYPASTIHKALGLYAGDDGTYGEPQSLDADLVLVDEVSMLDIYIAGYLFEALKDDAQIVLIGDADQLPSVGPGAVLSEIIASEHIPVVRLDKVFRQNAGSRIATNAKLIRHGNLGLEYGSDFQFVDSGDIAESAKILAETYMREIAKYGVDNVALLAPYRQKTETGVNALNEIIRDLVNPPDSLKPEVKSGKRLFRLGDKVMQIKNFEDVNNGDIGYIKAVHTVGNETSAQVDFGEDKIKWYESDDLNMLDLGYASTIHKSQGSEYTSVIINLQCAHSIMLTRPLIYTAITRGKERVIIVGERRALCIAINKKDTEKRGTCLAVRIKNKLK